MNRFSSALLVSGITALLLSGCSALNCKEDFQCGWFKPSVSDVIDSLEASGIACANAVVRPDLNPLLLSGPFEIVDINALPDELYCNSEDPGPEFNYSSDLILTVFESSSELDSYYDLMCLNGATVAVWMLSENTSIEQQYFLKREVPKSEADTYAAALSDFSEARAFSCNQ